MVWGLFPVESSPGEQKYYLLHKGTYKAGRKDCDVIIRSDKGVSRVHAELIVDALTSWGPQNNSSTLLSDVRIIDKSKYGTFVNKAKGSKSVNEFPKKETVLKDGDLISFGTGNAVFRFCYVPLLFFVTFQSDSSLQKFISSIGACLTHDWDPNCTHVLVDEPSDVSEGLIEAIVAKKPVISSDWAKVASDKKVCTELPSFTNYLPNVQLEGISIKIAEPKDRENCLTGRTFVLGSSQLYKFGHMLKSLLEAANAKVFMIDEFSSTSQESANAANSSLVLVISSGLKNEFMHFHQFNMLSRVVETKLVAAVFAGNFDLSIVESPAIIVSSSHSTDETIVADSDVEMDTAATSEHIADVTRSDAPIYDKNEELLENQDVGISEKKISIPDADVGVTIEKIYKDGDSAASENEKSDILYSQDLIKRNDFSSFTHTQLKKTVNFKCFKKRETPSGNSFKDLIPFSKYPYKESDCANELEEFVKKEKKRKQLEAVAEDLFNTEKMKRKAAAGAGSSLRDLFTRR